MRTFDSAVNEQFERLKPGSWHSTGGRGSGPERAIRTVASHYGIGLLCRTACEVFRFAGGSRITGVWKVFLWLGYASENTSIARGLSLGRIAGAPHGSKRDQMKTVADCCCRSYTGRRITPKGQLRATPAPSRLNCDTSCHQLLRTDRPARQLHPTLGRACFSQPTGKCQRGALTG